MDCNINGHSALTEQYKIRDEIIHVWHHNLAKPYCIQGILNFLSSTTYNNIHKIKSQFYKQCK